MRNLVTGGAGFIGSNIVSHLVSIGQEVVVLDNLSSGKLCNLEKFKRAEFINGDIRDSEAVEKAAKGCDVIYHLAASVGNKRSIDFPIADAEINVLGTLRVLEAARKSKINKIVVSSSAGIFGELKTLPIREDHPIDPDSPYGSTKLCEEKLSLSYAKLYGIEVVAFRYFNVYGPNQIFDAYGNVIPIFVFKLLRGESIDVYGDGEQTRDFINVSDVVKANVLAGVSIGKTGAYNLGSGTQITINQLIEHIGEFIGQKPIVNYLSPRLGDVKHSRADITAVSQSFNFSPSVDIVAGLKEYVSWAKSQI